MHLQLRKKSWVEHRDHLGIPFGIHVIPVWRGMEASAEAGGCVYVSQNDKLLG